MSRPREAARTGLPRTSERLDSQSEPAQQLGLRRERGLLDGHAADVHGVIRIIRANMAITLSTYLTNEDVMRSYLPLARFAWSFDSIALGRELTKRFA